MRNPRVLGAAGAFIVLAMPAMSCSAPASAPMSAQMPSASQRATDFGSAPTSDPAAATPTTPAPAGPKTITLAFAGDVHFERQVAALLDDSDAEWSRRLPELAKADFSMVNLETALTTRGAPEPKTYTFRAPAKALDALKAGGVDAVSSANNHAADFGDTGIQDTLAAKASGTLPMLGFGRNVTEAFAPLTVHVKGVDVGVLASTQVMDRTATVHAATDASPGVATNGDLTRLLDATRTAAADHDLVVVYVHWGTEGSSCPDERQQATAQALERAGADVVVGTHAHRTQGMGWKGRTFVGYGLGNFVWYNTSPTSRPSGMLTVTVDADAARQRGQTPPAGKRSLVMDYDWVPKYISTAGVPRAPEGSAVGRLADLHRSAQRCTGLATEPGKG